MSECTLTNSFGQSVQILVAFLVLIVLTAEYLVDVVHSWCVSKNPKREAIQFWFDVFKISCGAAVSHLFNFLISMYLSNEGGGDECALYALAFVYEGSGVPFVQLLTYCVVKYAETMKHVHFWAAISRPGEYGYDDKLKRELNIRNRDCQKNLILALIPSSLCLLLGMELHWGFQVTYVGPFFTFMFFFTFFYTGYTARRQVFAWCVIKIFEKGIWTGFVVAQSKYFEEWSKLMELKSTHMEAIYYVCLIPIAMNAFMFFMFSRISRLQLPCINVQPRSGSSSDKRRFDVGEGLRVGVIFCLIMNSVLWLACSLAFQNTQVIVVLLVSMVILPTMMCTILLFVGYMVVNWQYTKCRSDNGWGESNKVLLDQVPNES